MASINRVDTKEGYKTYVDNTIRTWAMISLDDR